MCEKESSELDQEPVIIDSDRREIWVTGEIDEFVVRATMRGLGRIVSGSTRAPVSLLINSEGGYLTDGLAMCDYMKWLQAKHQSLVIETRVIGMSYSAAAVISSSGTKGHRSVFKSGRFLIHQLSADNLNGKMEEIAKVTANLKAGNDCMALHLAENTGKSFEEICEHLKSETYMSADEAVKFGLVDTVL